MVKISMQDPPGLAPGVNEVGRAGASSLLQRQPPPTHPPSPGYGATRGRWTARGFTLLELLVAIALAAILITVVAGAFAAGLRVWQRASGTDGPYQDAIIALELMQKDIRNATPFRLVPFQGGASRIEIPALVAVQAAGGTQEQPGAIRYEFSASTRKLERVTRVFLVPGGEKESREVILDKVSQVRFAYADPGSSGKGPLIWSDTWAPGTNTPAAIKVSLQSPSHFDFERMIVQPLTPTQDIGPRTH